MTLFAAVAGCAGGGTGADPDEELDATTTTSASPQTTETTASIVTTTSLEATTTTTPGVRFGDLNEAQQGVVDSVCKGEFSDMTYLLVVSGESGVAELEEAFNQLGQQATTDELSAAAETICDEIGWLPLSD